MPSILDILLPGGKPIGAPGTRGSIREIAGSTLKDAEDMFKALTAGGTQLTGPKYPGVRFALPGGGTVSLRRGAKRGWPTIATIDVDVPGCPVKKLKFNA